mmetsp:Transcript_25372/g.47277  ORF Transcript_25372/g.47277 Transcript_25372/m.47277 type:complete len:112 (+) Transcript_25372:240-575(+)
MCPEEKLSPLIMTALPMTAGSSSTIWDQDTSTIHNKQHANNDIQSYNHTIISSDQNLPVISPCNVSMEVILCIMVFAVVISSCQCAGVFFIRSGNGVDVILGCLQCGFHKK